ncbi:centrosomal protein kizuna [Megalops cyprinoides]|uniref:centrosomal protein kizuna n=1 Tax=Megalops cyprinoides TaxID=118141 RepID=UPI001863A2E8|nr:centrosomal protein kizuna [Megalops cyprinoides]
MAFCEKGYFEKIGKLQQDLHESEKRRFELERELLAFRRSERRISQIRNGKLRGYLKEICERENRAKTRNLELRKDMERIELHMKELRSTHIVLHQKKEKVLQGPACKNSSLPLTRGLYQPATIFMGRQTVRVSSELAPAARTAFVQPPKPDWFSNTAERSESGVQSDSTILQKDADDVLDGGHFSTGRKKSERKGRTAAAFDFTVTATGLGVESFAPPVTSMEAEKMVPPPTVLSRNAAGSPPAERGLAASSNHIATEDEGGSLPPAKECQDVESDGISSSSVDIDTSVNTESELSLTLSDDEDVAFSPEDLAHPDAHRKKTGIPRGLAKNTGTPRGTGHRSNSTHAGSKDTEGSEVGGECRRDVAPLPSEPAAVGPSLEGFSHLLESIEERLHESTRKPYGISSISQQNLSRLISLCDRKAGLNDEDLEACGAAVLHQLQRLSWSVSKGCLLPGDIVSANWTSAEDRKIRSSLPPDGAQLWDRWFRHALTLQECGGFTADQIVELFTQCLVEKNASYLDKAKVLLRSLLEEACGGLASAESEESVGGSPSLPNDGQIQAARPACWPDTHRSAVQGLQSGEEDSEEESFVESIPIRETKAYQLLKQSAVQQTRQSSQEEEDGLDVLASGVVPDRPVEHAGKGKLSDTSSSLSQEGPVRSGKALKKTVPAVQSKAFWGESDDSNTDIEAALRPRSRSTTNDDFDDFYD